MSEHVTQTPDPRRAADEAARSRAQAEFSIPIALEAGAGTGKTATLVARVIAWSIGPGWAKHSQPASPRDAAHPFAPPSAAPPDTIASHVLERVVAITFTDKAAAEMAQRMAEALGELARGKTPKGFDEPDLDATVLRERARALLAGLDRLRVMTIHSFCRSVLSAHPLEAGLHPAFQVDADQSEAAAVAEECVGEALPRWLSGRAASDDPADAPAEAEAAMQLLLRGLGPSSWCEALTRLVLAAVELDDLRQDPFSDAALRPVLQAVRAAVTSWLAAAGPIASGGGQLKSARLLIEQVEALGAQLDDALASTDPLAGWLATAGDLLGDKERKRLEAWAQDELTATERKAAKDESAVVAESERLISAMGGLLDCDPALTDALTVLAALYEPAQRRYRELGFVSFDGLLALTARLLREREDVAHEVRRGIDQLLVDEFQDTDPVQCSIVGRLALDGDAAQGPGLFVVGDPKQSIYGWRSADLRAYTDFVQRMVAAGGEKHALIVNYRSVMPILEEVQRTVGPLMPAGDPDLTPVFEHLLAAEHLLVPDADILKGRRPVEHWAAYDWTRNEEDTSAEDASAEDADSALHLNEKTGSDRARALEAAAIAHDLAHLQASGGLEGPAPAALLFRSLRVATPYLDALRDAGVPYAIANDADFYRRREVIDAINLVATAFDPTDQVALVGWLRSPSVGVPDAAWLPLWTRSFAEHVGRLGEGSKRDVATLASLRQLVSAAAADVPADAPALSALGDWTLPLGQALADLAELRRTANQLPADEWVALIRTRTGQEWTEGARYLGHHRVANLERFYRALRDSLVDGHANAGDLVTELRQRLQQDDRDSSGASAEEPGAVQIMSIHKAKGLAFEHVYLVNVHGQSRSGDAAPAFAWGSVNGRPEMSLMGLRSPGFASLRERERTTRAGEQIRTLYVALTRARQRVVTTGLWADRAGEVDARKAKSYAELMLHRSELGGLVASPQSGPNATYDDESGVHWRWCAVPAAQQKSSGDDSSAPGELPLEDTALLHRAAQSAVWRQRAERAARRRAERVQAAAEVMGRNPQSKPSSHHVAFERIDAAEAEELAGISDGTAADAPGATGGRQAAMLAGTWVHRALERWDPSRPVDQERERALSELRRICERSRSASGEASAEAAVAEAAAATAERLIEKFASGPLAPRLAAVHIVGREIPFCAAEVADGSTVSVGAIDLVYREADTSEVVVADFKTDRVPASELPSRAESYRAQGEAYADAVQRALRLPTRPRVELWFVELGEIVAL